MTCKDALAKPVRERQFRRHLGLFCDVRVAPFGWEAFRAPLGLLRVPQEGRGGRGPVPEALGEGREAYFCVHLLTTRRRTKEHAAPILALWADADGSSAPKSAPRPTAVVERSPGRR